MGSTSFVAGRRRSSVVLPIRPGGWCMVVCGMVQLLVGGMGRCQAFVPLHPQRQQERSSFWIRHVSTAPTPLSTPPPSWQDDLLEDNDKDDDHDDLEQVYWIPDTELDQELAEVSAMMAELEAYLQEEHDSDDHHDEPSFQSTPQDADNDDLMQAYQRAKSSLELLQHIRHDLHSLKDSLQMDDNEDDDDGDNEDEPALPFFLTAPPQEEDTTSTPTLVPRPPLQAPSRLVLRQAQWESSYSQSIDAHLQWQHQKRRRQQQQQQQQDLTTRAVQSPPPGRRSRRSSSSSSSSSSSNPLAIPRRRVDFSSNRKALTIPRPRPPQQPPSRAVLRQAVLESSYVENVENQDWWRQHVQRQQERLEEQELEPEQQDEEETVTTTRVASRDDMATTPPMIPSDKKKKNPDTRVRKAVLLDSDALAGDSTKKEEDPRRVTMLPGFRKPPTVQTLWSEGTTTTTTTPRPIQRRTTSTTTIPNQAWTRQPPIRRTTTPTARPVPTVVTQQQQQQTPERQPQQTPEQPQVPSPITARRSPPQSPPPRPFRSATTTTTTIRRPKQWAQLQSHVAQLQQQQEQPETASSVPTWHVGNSQTPQQPPPQPSLEETPTTPKMTRSTKQSFPTTPTTAQPQSPPPTAPFGHSVVRSSSSTQTTTARSKTTTAAAAALDPQDHASSIHPSPFHQPIGSLSGNPTKPTRTTPTTRFRSPSTPTTTTQPTTTQTTSMTRKVVGGAFVRERPPFSMAPRPQQLVRDPQQPLTKSSSFVSASSPSSSSSVSRPTTTTTTQSAPSRRAPDTSHAQNTSVLWTQRHTTPAMEVDQHAVRQSPSLVNRLHHHPTISRTTAAHQRRRQQQQQQQDQELRPHLLGDPPIPVSVQAESQKTLRFTTAQIGRVGLSLRNLQGRPVHALVRLLQGPEDCPQYISVYSEDGGRHPFTAILETPGDNNSLCICNTGPSLSFPLTGTVTAELEDESTLNAPMSTTTTSEDKHPKPPLFSVLDRLAQSPTAAQQMIQGGASRTFGLDQDATRAEIMLTTSGRSLNAVVEILYGPDNTKQVMEVYSDNGTVRPLFVSIETPHGGSLIKVLNKAPIAFPLTASVEAFSSSTSFSPSSSTQPTSSSRRQSQKSFTRDFEFSSFSTP